MSKNLQKYPSVLQSSDGFLKQLNSSDLNLLRFSIYTDTFSIYTVAANKQVWYCISSWVGMILKEVALLVVIYKPQDVTSPRKELIYMPFSCIRPCILLDKIFILKILILLDKIC